MIGKIVFILITCGLVFSVGGGALAGVKRAVIDTPNPCTKVEKIEGKNIYLKSSGEPCIQVIGKAVVEVDSDVRNVFVYVGGQYWNEQEVREFNIESIPDMKKLSDTYRGTIKTDNVHTDTMKKLADESAKYYHSDEYQKKIKAETKRIKTEIFGKKLGGYYADAKKDDKRQGKLSPSERIYIFVSSSMPLETIRAYVADIDSLRDENIIFVMRGFIGGMKHIRPTIDFTGKALVKDKSCDLSKGICETYNVNFEVDPLLFRKYGITRVPAFVYVPRLEVMDRERSEGSSENVNVSDFYVLYGDAAFEYILDTFYKETKSQSLSSLKSSFSHP